MLSLRGFYDLNVPNSSNRKNVLDVCQALLDLGYRTIAINTYFALSGFEKKKKDKDVIPEPECGDIIEHFKGKLSIYTRLTVEIDEQKQMDMLSSSANAKKYDLLAVVPKSQKSFERACGTLNVDIISYDPLNKIVFKISRKMYFLAVKRGIFFELMYAPIINAASSRKDSLSLGHSYYYYGKSKNIIISSGASLNLHVRGPYNVINLGLLFGLNEEQAKGALTTVCRRLLLHADGRRRNKALVIVTKNCSSTINSGEVSEDEMEVEESQQPAKKKLRQT